LARLLRPHSSSVSISKLGNRIRALEHGREHKGLLDQVVAALGISAGDLALVAEQEATWRSMVDDERRRDWEAWADEAVKPFVVIRLIPAIYGRREAPLGVIELPDAEAWACRVGEVFPWRPPWRVCLHHNRRLRSWVGPHGSISHRTQAKPGDEDLPYTVVGNKGVTFAV
jgi:hypothetical protein